MARGDSGPDQEKITVAFDALDSLIPGLGVYTRIFKKLRDDLFDAVYSDDLTTQDGEIVKIPYFVHITRRQNQQTEHMDELEDQLDIVKKRLFEKHKQYEELQRQSDDQRQTIEDLEQDLKNSQNTIVDKGSEIDRLEYELQKLRNQWEREQQRFEGDIHDSNEALAESKQEIEFLSKYKKGYDDLYYAFLDQPEEDTPKKKKPIVSTKRANLITNIELAQKLEEQIMTVLNTAVEEFDKFMEEHKNDLQAIEVKDDITDAEFEAQEIDIDNADQQLESVQERFKNTIGDISNELLLLKQHSTMLMEQLQILEENHPTIVRKGDRLKIVDTVSKSDSILSAGLGDDEDDDDDSDPFIPQERVFCKYAAMLYTSNNQGRSFEEFKDAKYCASCGEKTVICPHKLPGTEKVFPVPIHCTHLKIVRPMVRINKELMRELMKPQEEDGTYELPSTAGSKFDVSRDHSMRGFSRSSQSPPTSRDTASMVGSEAHMPNSVHSVFDDYKTRTNLERNIPRQLSIERCLSLIEQFWTYVIWQDDNGKDEDIHLSIIDKQYHYMEERYMVSDIMYLCIFDFLSAVVEYSEQNKMIQLFSHILAGNLEGACFRYIMLLGDFIAAVDWKEVEDFRAFASVVYPFLGEDDLETLQMSYTSYSENKISRSMVSQFIVHLILKYREPRFLEMENKLIPFQDVASKVAAMSEREFKDTIDNVLPLTNDKLRCRLFCEAEQLVKKDGHTGKVPIMRLAQISSYLGLLAITNIVRDTIAARIQEWRGRPSSSGSTRVLPDHDSQLVHADGRLVTMANVKQLSTNISRRLKLRQERYEMGEEGSDW